MVKIFAPITWWQIHRAPALFKKKKNLKISSIVTPGTPFNPQSPITLEKWLRHPHGNRETKRVKFPGNQNFWAHKVETCPFKKPFPHTRKMDFLILLVEEVNPL